MRALPFLLVVITIKACAGPPLDESELVDLISQSVYSDHDDGRLADNLGRVRLNERLRPGTIQELERLGLGPLSLTALKDLQERSSGLPAAAVNAIDREPVPSTADQDHMVQQLKRYASTYIRSLPNFLCEEVTERYSNLHGRASSGNARYSKQLRHADTLNAQLAFAPGSQQDRLRLSSDAELARRKLGRSTTAGEFGRDMAIILSGSAQPELKWDRWERHQSGKQAVFTFFVPQTRSEYNLFFCCYMQAGVGEMQQSYKAAIRGLIYADPRSGEIQRLVIQAVDMPHHFHVDENNTIIHYGKVTIAGRTYNLPVSAVVFVQARSQRNRNEIAFLDYRKYDAHSVLTDVRSKITYIQ